jgi:hypothetical protein
MPDAFTPLLRLQQPAVDGDPNTWGGILDTDLGLLDTAIAGVSTIALSGPAVTLQAANGQPDQARACLWIFTGTLTQACTVTIPATARLGWIINATNLAEPITLTTGQTGGATLLLPNMERTFPFRCDGVGIYPVDLVTNSLVAGGPVSDDNQLRLVDSTLQYGAILRNDGSNTYLLLTPTGTPYQPYNGLRPFFVNNATGAVTLDGTGAGTTINGPINAPVAFAADFANPGFQQFPTGLLLQFGSATTAAGGTIINFPKTFPRGVYSVTATPDTSDFDQFANVLLYNNVGFRANVSRINATGNPSSVASNIFWMAMGW